MKHLIIISLVILLFGCGFESQYGQGWPTWTGEQKEENEHFIINYNEYAFNIPQMSFVEEIWAETQGCAGIHTDLQFGKLVIEYVNVNKMPSEPPNMTGYIIYRNRYIRLIDSDPWYDNQVLKHEFVHYLLYTIGTPQFEQDTHESELFHKCVY